MTSARPVLPLLFSATGMTVWLVLAALEARYGYDTGGIGSAILVLAAWSALYGLWRLPLEGIERAIAPAEWKAWFGTVFMAVAVGYFIVHIDAFQVASLADSPRARKVGTHLVLLLIAWTVLSSALDARWNNRVLEDERDLDIQRRGAGWARGAMTAMLVGLAVLLGISPADRLEWATLPMVANLLVLVLMVGCLFENAAIAIRHLLDRR